MTPETYVDTVRNMVRASLGSSLNGDVAVSYRARDHIKEHEYTCRFEAIGPREQTTANETVDGVVALMESTDEVWAALARTPVRGVGRDARTGRYARVYRFEVVAMVEDDSFAGA